MLEIKDLHVQFHTSDHEAVRGIDLTVQDGEIMGLVGESGSGKTVTAMMVSGLLRPEQADFRGRILLDGEDLLHAGGQRIRAIQGKDICVVFQEPMSAMDPTMRIGKQVEECLRVHTDLSAQERRQRALQALRDVELPDPEGVYRKYPHELSGGMLQRVMIAAAIVARPRLLLADEPTTALDVTIQKQILNLFLELQESDRMSIMMVTHDIGVAAQVADQIAIMYGGIILECGATRQVLETPANPYTKALIAALPKSGNRERLVAIEGQPPTIVHMPPGCPFSNRCAYATEACRQSVPELKPIDEHHMTACHMNLVTSGGK